MKLVKKEYFDDPDNIDYYTVKCEKNLGSIYTDKREYQKAKDYLADALKLIRPLVAKDSDLYSSELIDVLKVKSYAHYKAKEYSVAKECQMEALQINRKQNDSLTYKSNLATGETQMGLIYSHLFDFTESRNAYLKALKIDSELLKVDSEKFHSFLATEFQDLGLLYTDYDYFKSASKALNKSLEISSALAKNNPQTYEEWVGEVEIDIAHLKFRKKKFLEAFTADSVALSIFQKLAIVDPETNNDYLSVAENLYGLLYDNIHKTSFAESYYIKAWELRKNLANANPKAYYESLNETAINLISLYFNIGDTLKAQATISEIKTIYREFEKQDTVFFAEGLADILCQIAKTAVEYHYQSDAENLFLEALSIVDQLSGKENYWRDLELSIYQNSLARFYEQVKDYKKATFYFKKNIFIWKNAANKDSFTISQLIKAEQSIAEVYVLDHHSNKAKKSYFEALNSAQKNLVDTDEFSVENLGSAYEGIGEFYNSSKEFKHAQEYLTNALKTLQTNKNSMYLTNLYAKRLVKNFTVLLDTEKTVFF